MHKHSLRRWLLLGTCLSAWAAALRAQESAPPQAKPADEQQPLQFQLLDEPLEPFRPLKQRSEAELDLIKAQAWFSTAHLQYERRDYLGAYRAYQHVVRYDPTASEAYDALWRLAARLRRFDAAVRYMLKLVELDSSRYRDLQSLATVLGRFDEVPQAVKLLEQARNSPDLDKQSPAYVVLMHKLGQLYSGQERYPEAAEAYRVVLDALEQPQHYQLKPNQLRSILGAAPDDVSIEAAQALVEAAKADEALAVLQKLRTSDPENAKLSYSFAQTYLKLDRPEDAFRELEEHFRKVRRITDPAAYQLQAEILEKLGRKDELIPALENAEGQNSVRSYFLAEQYRLAGDYDKAEKLFVAMLAQDPKPEGYRGLAAVYRETKRYDALLDHLEHTWVENEGLGVVQEELQATAHDAEAVGHIVATMRKRLEEAPNDVPLGSLYAAALLARLADQREAAEQFYRAALGRRSDAGWYFELGRMHFLAKDYKAAAAVFAEAAEKTEGSLLFQIFLVRSLTLDGQTDKALEAAEHARQQLSEQEENRPEIVASLRALKAWVYYYAQRYDEAQHAYESLIEEYWPKWPYGLVETDGVLPNALRDAHFALSNIYVERGDQQRSEELLLRILEDDPEDPHANNDLGYLWADQNKHLDKAEAMIRKAVEDEPENAAYLDSLGWVLFRKQQYDQARELLEQALGKLPEGDPVMWEHLGDVYDKLRQTQKARDAYSKALELLEQGKRPDPKRAEEIKKKRADLSP